MLELIQTPEPIQIPALIRDQKWPGFYGARWNGNSGLEKLILLKTVSTDKHPYFWATQDLMFFGVGRAQTIQTAMMHEEMTYYSFDSLKELTEWLTSPI